jgi:hypothetical protein
MLLAAALSCVVVGSVTGAAVGAAEAVGEAVRVGIAVPEGGAVVGIEAAGSAVQVLRKTSSAAVTDIRGIQSMYLVCEEFYVSASALRVRRRTRELAVTRPRFSLPAATIDWRRRRFCRAFAPRPNREGHVTLAIRNRRRAERRQRVEEEAARAVHARLSWRLGPRMPYLEVVHVEHVEAAPCLQARQSQ